MTCDDQKRFAKYDKKVDFVCGFTCGCPELQNENSFSWGFTQLALTQVRLAPMGGVVGLDFEAVFSLLDEYGLDDPVDRHQLFQDTLEVFEVFRSYQDEYRSLNIQRAEAEQARRRAAAAK